MREAKVYQEIMEEGEIKARRADVLQVLRIRFGPRWAEEFSAAVNVIEDIDELTRMLNGAVRCSRPPDFRKALPTD